MAESINRRELLGMAAATAAIGFNARAQRASERSDDVTSLTIAEAGRRIASRDLSSVELTRAYLERIAQLNPRVNAYITVTAEQALEQARTLDEELARGRN